MYEGELNTIWIDSDGKWVPQANVDYRLSQCTDRGASVPPGSVTVYFQCEKAVLDQMQADSVDIVWSKELET